MTPPETAREQAQKVAETMLAREGAGPAWGIEIEAADAGYSRVSMRLRDTMLNGHGTAHGGFLFFLADTAFAYACNSRNATTVAQSCSIVFLDPGRPGEKLVAEAKEQSLKGRSGVYTATVFGEDGRTIAIFQGVSRAIGGTII